MKRIQFLSVFILVLLLNSGQLYCQDILYKNDKTVLKVTILDFNGKTVIYRPLEDATGAKYYISKSVLDSIKYQDGRSLNLTSQYIYQVPAQIPVNSLGVELNNLFHSNLNLSYERMAKNGRTSLVAGLLINIRPGEYEGWISNSAFEYSNFDSHFFFTRFGINFYPFNYSLVKSGNFRFSNGFSLLLGTYRQLNWGQSSVTYDPLFATSVMWNINGKLYLGKMLQINGGIELSVGPFFTFFCPEIGLSFGF
jgi:hypothetical protein